ncbi:MAG: aldehyde dehydrogenase family protein [Bacteroidetes bacterium]|nr:aldehyde dehydrogenase family protein [Bacteroidota bacterium]
MPKVKSTTLVKKVSSNGTASLNGKASPTAKRLDVQKTFKLYIDGKFPRSESGRYFKLNDKSGNLIANICRGSKKDFRDAVVVARKAQESWAKRSAYNKGQILYRIAETLEGRKSQFINSLIKQGAKTADAENEVAAAIDRFVHYAGWSDKYQQIFSAVNPVESSHFNFSFPEPTGVVSAIAPQAHGLLGLVSVICPAIVGGNAIIILPAENAPLTAIELAEVLHASDLPGGVVNIITGFKKELITPFSNHMDVNASVYCGNDVAELTTIQTNASLNVKRVIHYSITDWLSPEAQSPYMIMDLQEIKTTWHPVGI